MVLVDGNGNFVKTLQGLATGSDGSIKPIGFLPSDKLKFYQFDFNYGNWYSANSPQVVLFSGTQADVMSRWNAAVSCGNEINNKGFSYPFFGFGPNSNSVASTLVSCMGLSESPIPNGAAVTPGYKTILLDNETINKIQTDNGVTKTTESLGNIIKSEVQSANSDGTLTVLLTYQNGTTAVATRNASGTTEIKNDVNGDGKWDQVTVETDVNKDGIMDSIVSSGDTQSSLFTADKQLDTLHDQGLLSNDIWNDYTNWSTFQLVNYSPTQYVPSISNPYDPIGAFYETKSAGLDTAASIANKTIRILNSAGVGLTAAQLVALDTNADGKLSGTELNGLTAWSDLNEDGILNQTATTTNELTTLAAALTSAGLGSIRASDYAFYTAGNANYRTVAQNTATAPVNSRVAPATPVALASNYTTLRNTES